MTVEILKGSTVVISGPPATGKTALARRIFEQNPTKNKMIIPFPKSLLNHCVQRAQGKNPDNLTSEHFEYTQRITSARANKAFTICDGCYIDPESLTSFFYRMRVMRIYTPITLIKLTARREQQLRNIAANLANVPGYIAPTYEELDQQNGLFAEVVEREFKAEISWVEREYLLLNSDDIELKFL